MSPAQVSITYQRSLLKPEYSGITVKKQLTFLNTHTSRSGWNVLYVHTQGLKTAEVISCHSTFKRKINQK